MKFPLAASPFPSLQLSPQQCDGYERLATELLQETIDEYDRFVSIQRRSLSKTQWKAVKTRENLTVYKQRSDFHTPPEPSVSSSSSSTGSAGSSSTLPKSLNANWSLPKMLAVGSIVGSLEDVMYGIISPDMDAIKIKTTYVHDELIDGRVLFQIQYPTEEDPFKFLAVKWFVKAHPASVNAVVWPRDIVFIEGTGILRLPNGESIGYHLLQSVELPQCPELTQLGIMRCQFSSCFLFKQQSNGTVDVYMKSHVEPGGTIPDVVAVMSTANGLIGCWKSVWCSQNKKLSWMMKQAAATRARKRQFQEEEEEDCQPGKVRTNADGKQCCAHCEKKLPAFRRVITCELCRTVICSRCRTARKLSSVRRTGEVRMVATVFCKRCITQSTRLSSSDVARSEYVSRPRETRNRTRLGSQQASGAACRKGHRRVQSYDPDIFGSTGSVPPVFLLDGDLEISDLSVETIEEWEHEQHQRYTQPSVEAAAADDAQCSDRHAADQPTATLSDPDEYQKRLWMQMTRLRLAAEETYQFTKQNTQAIQGNEV